MDDVKIILNGKELTKEQFEEEKKKFTESKVQLVEISANVYKTRLQD